MRERDIFIEALEQSDPDRRAAVLDEACQADVELRGRVDRLLVEHERQESFILDSPQVGVTALYQPIAERPGMVIGPYKLLQQIGEGGMGVVYMAQQSHPIRRTVALKIIKPGMDTRQVMARFDAERQALALMDHPNIAKVLDAGATDSGRPYFIMELMKGVPITKYCDGKHLSLRSRLELMLPVCQAVQHAHQKGLIHRDIKPTNVLVAEYDDLPVPKVIDFGVAKAIAQTLTDRTMFTEFGQVIGTVEYMSPEQAKLNQLDADTRSDIYSLGVLLYELLTGSTPFGRERLQREAFDEMLRIIREEEPPKPSTRLSTADALPSIAANRSSEPLKLNRLVQGELDWIVMKALEKDRNQRYETANSLAADIERYLKDEAVEACPPSARYRLQKFLRRNKAPIVTAGLVFSALLAGVVGTTWGLIEARGQRDTAVASATAERQAKETTAAREAETAAVLEFVEEKIFAAARPEGVDGGLGSNVSLREAVNGALPFVEDSFQKQPLIEARLRITLGNSFQVLGEYQGAADQFDLARSIYVQHLGPDDRSTLACMMYLADAYEDLGRNSDALKLGEETLALMKSKLGLKNKNTLMCMVSLANIYDDLGRYDDALRLREETLTLHRATLGPRHSHTLTSMGNLANTYVLLGRYPEALKLREKALKLEQETLGETHPRTLFAMQNLSIIYAKLGRNDEALALAERALQLMKQKLGADHPETLSAMYNLATMYEPFQRYEDLLKLSLEVLTLTEAKLGADHPDTILARNNVVVGYFYLDREDEAVKFAEENATISRLKLGAKHPTTLVAFPH